MTILKTSWIFRVLLLLSLCGCGPSIHDQKVLSSGDSPNADSQDSKKNMIAWSKESLLRKLSYHLKGVPPQVDEYEDLAQQPSESLNSFFQKKIEEYLASPAYVEKMNFRLNELFQLRPQNSFSGLWPTPSELADRQDYLLNYNSLNDLFRGLARGNGSWDLLATAKSYSVYSAANSFFALGFPDSYFFQGTTSISLPGPYIPGPHDSAPAPFSLAFSEHDPRIAGAVTTARFFLRYRTTGINRNRRRAAAVFRIFLCDDMKAAIPDSPTKVADFLAAAFPQQSSEKEIIAIQKNQHGEDPACYSCHSKLDPFGKAFEASPSQLGSFASPGILTFKRKDGTALTQHGEGLGDLMEQIVKTPEYVSCQVRHFWNWFIGEDVLLSSERESELVKAFDAVERKTNSFVKLLVSSPEFKVRPTEESSNGVKELLNRCNKCHSQGAPQIPSFTVSPIGGSQQQALEWLKKIRGATGLEGESSSMPPSTSSWVLSIEEKSTLRRWIDNGGLL